MFRNLVSRSRRRYLDEGYNLDLSYIIENRLIVMSFPGSGTIETTYRNDYDTVSDSILLNYSHRSKNF